MTPEMPHVVLYIFHKHSFAILLYIHTFLTNPLLTLLSSKDDEAISGVVSDGASGHMSLKDTYWFAVVA